MNYEYFRETGTHETILDFSDLMGVSLRGVDVLGFDTRWNEVLLSSMKYRRTQFWKAYKNAHT